MTALDFACYLGRLTKSKITGVFLENLPVIQPAMVITFDGSSLPVLDTNKTSPDYGEKRKLTDDNISRFKKACENRAVRCNVHRDKGVPVKEIIAESRYADLVVVDPATSFNASFEGTPTEFVKDILKDAECPVIIAPEIFDPVDEIIFTYDGSKSAAFAIKQFAYLFPQLEDKRVVMLQVNEAGEWSEEDKHNLTEWLQNRYSAIGFLALKGDTDDRLFDYLFKRKNSLLVMGAYGRPGLSRFFRRSHADRIIRTMTLPIFSSHY